MSISTVSTYTKVKKRLQESVPSFADFSFGSNTGIGVYGFSVIDTNIGTNAVANLVTGYSSETDGYLSFAYDVTYNNAGAAKTQDFCVCMIRESDRLVKIGKVTDAIAGAGNFTFNSFYYDAGSLYLNYTDPSGPTNYYIQYSYSTGAFSARAAGQYTTGTALAAAARSFAGYTWTGQGYTLLQTGISYYSLKAQFS